MQDEAKNSEISVEAEQIARRWVKDNLYLIERTLLGAIEETKNRLEKLYKMYDDVSVNALFPGLKLADDPFSSTVCQIFLEKFPEQELGLMQKTQAIVNFEMDGKEVSINHYFFALGNLIIDPTFGQFLELDQAILEHPRMFENRIMVATAQEAFDIFGVKYNLEVHNSGNFQTDLASPTK